MKLVDPPLLAVTLAIGSISTLVIYSINHGLGASQLVYWFLGLLIVFIFSQLNYTVWQKFSIFVYAFSILVLILLFFIADPVRGSTRWIDLGFFRFQPSEIAKVGLILTLANFFKEKSAKNPKNIILSALVVTPAFILVFFQPDLGNAVSLLAIWAGITLAAGMRFRHLLVLTLTAAIVAFTAFELLAPYQKERLETFIDPTQDPLGTGYNIIQSKIAVGSGMLLGRGLGRGSQSQLNFLPEAESDFIFASIVEQLGFLGALILIGLFSTLSTRVISFTKNTDRFGQLILVGIASFLIFQFTVNIGMNIGLVPVTGITLPLVSYGGSSLISTLLLLSIALSINQFSTQTAKYYYFS